MDQQWYLTPVHDPLAKPAEKLTRFLDTTEGKSGNLLFRSLVNLFKAKLFVPFREGIEGMVSWELRGYVLMQKGHILSVSHPR